MRWSIPKEYNIAESESCLPPFEFSRGYTLECVDMANIGVKVALKSSDNREEDRAIILPPEECERFLHWLQQRIGKRTNIREEIKTAISESVICKEAKRQVMIAEKITSDIETFYEIIENDIGITADEIGDYAKKSRPVVFARDLIYFVTWLRFKLSALKIATIMGVKSHASPLLAFRKFDTTQINEQLYEQPDLLKIYKDAKKRYKLIVFSQKDARDGNTKSKNNSLS